MAMDVHSDLCVFSSYTHTCTHICKEGGEEKRKRKKKDGVGIKNVVNP
jgi:hypothetical protein